MELFYSELQKREVINISDGRSLGFIIDIKIKFPEGKLVGIVVPGRKVNLLLRFFDRTRLYIEEKNIVKIGGDVILVNLRPDCPSVKKPSKQCCPPPVVNNNNVDFDIISSVNNFDDDVDY